ncbi:hypothetical protein RF11_02045 [Thelohanellus kitauei]|uniref:Homeobox domain-containing protein n=1 Tax=Thelohanellus kitauei TaxID=669202 RepID=A0A0C2ILT4_THEKT|nr:hypothetical protein RF11_02045 [Thelohanellus kitauei]
MGSVHKGVDTSMDTTSDTSKLYRRNRTKFTKKDLEILEMTYLKTQYPKAEHRKYLSSQLHVNEFVIQRAREKSKAPLVKSKEMDSTVQTTSIGLQQIYQGGKYLYSPYAPNFMNSYGGMNYVSQDMALKDISNVQFHQENLKPDDFYKSFDYTYLNQQPVYTSSVWNYTNPFSNQLM